MSDRAATWSLRNLSAWSWKTGRALVPGWAAAVRANSICGSDVGYRSVVLRSIRDIDAAQWNELAGRHAVTRSHAYLEAIETAAINDYEYFYPVVYDAGNEMVAHTCVYTVTTDFAQLLPSPLHWLVRRLRRLWPRLLQVRVTECASPLAGGHAFSIRAGEDPARLLPVLAATIAGIARAERSPLIVIRDFLHGERADFDTLLQHGYNLASSIPLARIRVRWGSYGEYLSGMRSRYRKDVRRRLRRARLEGQEIRVLETFAADAAIWAEQAHVIYRTKQGFKREILTREYYENLDHRLGDQSMLLVVERDGRMVAHGMVVTDDSNTTATYFGRDPGPPSKEWFQLINEAIRIGIARGSTYINLGRGSYDAKAIVGARIEPVYAYSSSTIACVNWLMRLVPNRMAEPVREPRRIFHN